MAHWALLPSLFVSGNLTLPAGTGPQALPAGVITVNRPTMLSVVLETVQGAPQLTLSLATLEKTGGDVQLRLPGAFTGNGAVTCGATVGDDGSDVTIVSATWPTGLRKGATVIGVCAPGLASLVR
jgi:hypothetical protein